MKGKGRWPLQRRLGRGFWLLAAATAAWMVVIFLFSAQNAQDSSMTSGRVLAFLCGLVGYTPTEEMKETLSFLVRKAAHMTEFGMLGVLWLATLRKSWGKCRWRYPAAFALASVYAMTDEAHQLLIDGRAGQITDWMIDSAGVLLWLTGAWIFAKIAGRNKPAENNNP